MEELETIQEATEELPSIPQEVQEVQEISQEIQEIQDIPTTFSDTEEETTEFSEVIREVPKMEKMTDNPMHQMFLTLGVNLDYVPQNDYECFTMALQFVVALWIISWFFKFIYSFMRDSFRGVR